MADDDKHPINDSRFEGMSLLDRKRVLFSERACRDIADAIESLIDERIEAHEPSDAWMPPARAKEELYRVLLERAAEISRKRT